LNWRPFIYVAIFFAVLFVLTYIYFPPFSEIQELRQERDALRQEAAALEAENRALEREKALLESDPVYIERVLREEYGFVRPDETVYKLVPTEPGATPETRGRLAENVRAELDTAVQ